MKGKRKMRGIKNALNGLIIAGCIMIVMGLYYLIVKAGIPYQNPPLELQIKYAVNEDVGKELCKAGMAAVVPGTVLRILLGIRSKRKVITE